MSSVDGRPGKDQQTARRVSYGYMLMVALLTDAAAVIITLAMSDSGEVIREHGMVFVIVVWFIAYGIFMIPIAMLSAWRLNKFYRDGR